LSDVTVAECSGAQSLGDMFDQGDETEIGYDRVTQSRSVAGTFAPSMRHVFRDDLICDDCGVSWKGHQILRSGCYKHVEVPNAPEEDPLERLRRVARFNEVYFA
jgi:hypothetical protein